MTFQEDLIDILTNEIKQLSMDYNKASIDGAADERAKIVAWLRNQDGYGYDDVRANCIEAGEHLK